MTVDKMINNVIAKYGFEDIRTIKFAEYLEKNGITEEIGLVYRGTMGELTFDECMVQLDKMHKDSK